MFYLLDSFIPVVSGRGVGGSFVYKSKKELSYRMSAEPPVRCPNWNFRVHQPADGSFGRAVLVVGLWRFGGGNFCGDVWVVMFGWVCFGGVGGFQQNVHDMWVMRDFL